MNVEYAKAEGRGLVLYKTLAGLAVLVASGIALSMPVNAATPLNTSVLPLSLAMDAATETIHACEAKGFRVAVAIVDADGVIKLQVRGDGSPIHSQGFSFRKAYTVMSMGPMMGADTNGTLIKLISGFAPALPAIATSGTPNLLFLPGSVLVKQNGQAIAAIGVSGAPKSADDEVCAQAGLDKIRSHLTDASPN
ncbi:heme-binding protein [Paraburkholderia bryophila]|uniref:GlcG/HbpS family heme-binding protein n=1 Tax=Paraburkholderia bryophila TaxID=420952 RepID=UPI002349301B|nr:heme-binding protein [Paraburkholderia bryophila]WCM18539.1 heme-binding protein [Paraburkholderia bryophila]